MNLSRKYHYTFGMAKQVFIQLKGVEKTIIIEADEVTEQVFETPPGTTKIAILRGSKKVGEFDGSAVAGWWIDE